MILKQGIKNINICLIYETNIALTLRKKKKFIRNLFNLDFEIHLLVS